MRKIIAALAVALAVLLGVLPFGFGLLTENQFEKHIDNLQTPDYTLTLMEYQRGWFKSKVLFKAQLTEPSMQTRWVELQKLVGVAEDNTEKDVKLVATILHGPLMFDRSRHKQPRLMVGRALIHSHLDDDAPIYQALQSLTNGKKLLHVLTLIKFTDGYKRLVMVSPIQFSQADKLISLRFEGARGKGVIDKKQLKSQIHIGAFKLVTPLVNVDMASIQANAVLKRGIADLWLGKADFVLSQFKLTGHGNTLGIDNLKLSESVLQSSENDKAIDMNLQFSIAALQLQTQSYGPIVFDVTLNTLDAQGVADFIALTREVQRNTKGRVKSSQDGLMLLAGLVAMQQQGPTYVLNQLSVTLPQGKLLAKGYVNVPVLKDANRLNPSVLLQFKAHLELSVPKILLAEAVLAQEKAKLAAQAEKNTDNNTDNESVQDNTIPVEAKALAKQAKENANARIERAVQQGFLTSVETQYKIVLHLEGGQLTINGVSVPLTGNALFSLLS